MPEEKRMMLWSRFKQFGSDLYWRQIFDKYDTDKNGCISLIELRKIIETTEYGKRLKENATEEIMKVSDSDSSGSLDFKEFKAMVYNEDLNVVFGHFLTEYVDFITPPRIPTSFGKSGPTGFQLVSPTDAEEGVQPVQSSRPFDIGLIPTYCDGIYEDRHPYSCWPPVLLMFLLSVTQITVYFYDFVHIPDYDMTEGPCTNVLMYDPSRRLQAWRFVTYMLAHQDIMHLLNNVILQLGFGIPLEFRQGWWRLSVVYLAGVFAGSLGASLADQRILVGASAGVYALMTAHIATIILNWSEMRRPYLQMGVFLVVTVVCLAYSTWQSHLEGFVGTYVAHLVGALAGLLVGIGILRNVKIRKWEERLWWAAVSLYFCIILGCILAHIFFLKSR